MATGSLVLPAGLLTAKETVRVWALHSICLVSPVVTLAYVLTGPHAWYMALLFLVPVFFLTYLDFKSPSERRQPVPELAAWPFDFMLYLLAAMQFTIIYLLGRMFMTQSFFSMDMLVTFLLVGGNSGVTAILLGHELIHRKEKHFQLLGRLLMTTVMYEHFCTEHVRGHHVRVGTAEDPATARFGERFYPFFKRTVPGQFKNAWSIEIKRHGLQQTPWWHPKHLRNHVLQGLMAEISLAVLIGFVFNWVALAAFVMQSLQAVRLLEVANFFEHWGLARVGPKVRTIDSWDTDSWFTLYTLVGLSRHADHHAHASRPYQQLRYVEESPKLPWGYLAMITMVLTNDRLVVKKLTRELERRQLGPFRPADAEYTSP